jgi:DUF4097 and DUF4098 domain-containing protein YvlB
MKTRTTLFFACSMCIPFFVSGCMIVGVDGGCWSWGGPLVWTEAIEERPIDATGLTALEVRTHNGSIDFQSQAAGVDASATIKKRAGGTSKEDAEEALAAINVFVERAGNVKTRIDWKWSVPKKARWSGDVSFVIRAPGNLNLDAETHNGAVAVAEVSGDVRVVSHNGKVKVRSSTGKLHAETHNGEVDATYAGPVVNLSSYNGEVSADLSKCGSVAGNITTHNGGVRIDVGKSTAATLKCQTHNGGIDCDAPLSESQKARGELRGKLGAGGPSLDVVTHNGSIRVKSTSG